MVSEKMVIDIDNLSEEGELKRSPDKQNFSDDDADTQDSLEIKPPQAVVHHKKSSGGGGGSSHRRGDKHAERSGNERMRDKDYAKSSSRHHDDRHHREKHRESRYRRHELTDQYVEKTRRSEPTKRDRDSSRYERKERSTGDRVLEDLRESHSGHTSHNQTSRMTNRLLDKRRERRDDTRDYKVETSSRSSDSRREESSSHRRVVITSEDPREQQQQQQQQQQRGSNGRHSMRHSDPNREKRHKRSHKHERTRDRDKEMTEREIAHREKHLRHQQQKQQQQQQQQQQQRQQQRQEEEEEDDDEDEEEEEEQPMDVDDYDSPEPVEPDHHHYRQHHQPLPPQKDPKDMNEQELRRHRLIEAEREMALMKKNSQLALEARRQKRGGEKRSHSPEEEALDPSVVHLSEDESEEKTDHSSSARASSGERSEESSEDSSSSTDTDESTESRSTRSRSESEHLRSPAEKSDEPRSPELVEESKLNGVEQEEEEMQLEKDPIVPQIELPPYFPAIQGCRNVEEYKCLNRIAEGTYGIVYRAEDKRTKEIVALKRLKMEKEKEGFPITSLREINTLLKAQHPNIVTVREIVVGSNMDKIFIVMDFIEHDLKSLMETMKAKNQAFIHAEVKCLMQQLLKAVAHLHDNWILHRDLKTSNLLLSHKGILKVGDFGLAREYGSPLKRYTSIVVTLWYRAPELLLGSKEYSTPVDMWSVGCIFAELLRMDALFPGKSETDLLNRVFKELGTPNDKVWPGYSELPLAKKMVFAHYPVNNLRQRFGMSLTEMGVNMLNKLLTYDPKQRITAEDALKHDYFTESPLPIDPSMFPTWPAKSEFGLRTANASPKPPSGGKEFKQLGDDEDNAIGFHMGSREASRQLPVGGGFHLKF